VVPNASTDLARKTGPKSGKRHRQERQQRGRQYRYGSALCCHEDAADFPGPLFREPHVTVRPGANPVWLAVSCWNGEFGNGSVGGNAPDLVGGLLGEP
jgi:hypothetical protein